MEPNQHMDIKRVVDNGNSRNVRHSVSDTGNPPKPFRTLEIVAVTLAVVLVGAFFYFHPSAPVGGQPVAIDVQVNSPATYTEPMTLKSAGKTFSISALGANPVQAVTTGNVTKYVDAFTNADVTETKQSDRIKEDIILKKPGHPANFKYQIDVAPYDVVKDEQGSLVFYQKGHSGDSNFWRFEIPAPFMIDAKGKKSTVSDIESTLTSDGILTVIPSAAWLASAAYPVDLDPTIIFVFRAASVWSCGMSVTGRDGLTYGTVTGADGKCWMDRNLGATQVATSYADPASYGDLYQWGRAPDGHQLITWTSSTAGTAVNGTTATQSDVPANSIFIAGASDWRVTPSDTLWANSGSTNNPCPANWHVPTQPEWATWTNAAGLTTGAGVGTNGTQLCSGGSGCLAAAYATNLKLPAAGSRDYSTGVLSYQSSFGRYWSSSPSATLASEVRIYSGSVDPADQYHRAYGYSARCLQDSGAPTLITIPTVPTIFRTTRAWSCGASSVTGLDGLTYGTVTGADGNCWMDRNLGATQVATAYNDTASYGDLYQWGRLRDGHQIRTSATTLTLSSTDVPGNSSFIKSQSSPYDWRSPQNNNLWSDVNRTNNVCPAGWHVPTQQQWAAWVTAASVTNSATAYSSNLKLTLAGNRDFFSAGIYVQGSSGDYWSSSLTGPYAYYLSFDSGGVNPVTSYGRAYGFSVRCMKDSNIATPGIATIFRIPPPPVYYRTLKTNQTLCYDDAGSVIACAGTGQDGELQKGVARSYADNGDGTITDNSTGLVWQKQDNATTYTWANALAYCNANTAALPGSNWRLPNVYELYSLVDFGVASAPRINSTYFPATQSGYYWSSTTYPAGKSFAMYVFFSSGSASTFGKANSGYVRCVRG